MSNDTCVACGCLTFQNFSVCPCCAVKSKSCPQLYPNKWRPPTNPVDITKAEAEAVAIFEANKDRWVAALRDGAANKKDPKEGWDGGLLAKLLYD